MTADMVALKDQTASMMEAMLSMERIMESNAAAVVAASAATEADPTHPSAINQSHQPVPDMVGQGGEVLGSASGPHMGYIIGMLTPMAYPPIICRPLCTWPKRTPIMSFLLPLRVRNPNLWEVPVKNLGSMLKVTLIHIPHSPPRGRCLMLCLNPILRELLNPALYNCCISQ